MMARASGRRNRRGRGLPGCGRGVTPPSSTKPKPSAASASTCSACLSSPAASPTGLGKSSPMTRTGALRIGSEKKRAASASRRVSSCAVSGSSEKRSGRASEYSMLARVPPPQPAPGAADEALDRLELRLVRHLRAFADPVAEVEVGQAQALARLDLPQHVVGAEARAAPVGLVEGVDRRKAVGQVVDDRHHDELAVLAELDQPRVDATLQEKVRMLVAAVVVHAAAGMALGLVAQVERVVLEAEFERLRVRDEVLVLLPGAPLRAVGAVLAYRDAHGDAGAARVAVRPVGEDAAAGAPPPCGGPGGARGRAPRAGGAGGERPRGGKPPLGGAPGGGGFSPAAASS